ncbi:MAG TPA: FAD-dependent oxidoreductase [Nocardioides sp.]|nr:FAD-dependent oxidoreductase [Nocardioides sp.]
MRKRVFVLGGSSGGLTTALAVHHELGGDVDVTVISKDDRVDITVPIGPLLHEHGIAFVQGTVARLDPIAREIFLKDGRMVHYDYAVIATGYRTECAGGIADDEGFIKVRDTCQTDKYDDLYAVGLPTTGFSAETMAPLAAAHIAAQIRGAAEARLRDPALAR